VDTEQKERPSSAAPEIAKQARDYAWNWFALHAAQRMQTFNFFLIAMAFITAGFGALIGNYPEAAMVVALLGAWVAFWFNRLDHRSLQIVEASEAALSVCEARLSDVANIPELRMVEIVAKPDRRASSYGLVISMIQWMIFAASLLGAAYAVANAI
jgi:hypothetical protein